MTSRLMLKEAAFYIELLHALEQRSDSLTNQATASEEASFLFSSVLGAFDACVAHMEIAYAMEPTRLQRLQGFKSGHPQIYGQDPALRAKPLHRASVVPAGGKAGAATGARVDRVFRQGPKLSTSKSGRRATDLRSQDEYQVFVQLNNDMVRGLEFVESHLALLRELHATVAGG